VKVLKFIAVNLAVFLILLVAVNWACGLYVKKTGKADRSELPNYDADREHARAIFADYNRVKHRYEPFVGWRTLPYNGPTTRISSEGRRVHDGNDSRTDKPVVRFFGGSTMWGEGADDNHTIPALFNALHPEYRVVNHGQLAYNSRQELDELISTYTRGERTDIVIFYDGVNDAAFLCPTVIDQLPAHRLVPMYREKLYAGTKAVIKDLAYRVFISNIMEAIQRISSNASTAPALYNCVSNPDKAEAIAEMMMLHWELAHELVSTRGGSFYAVLQPAAFIGKPRTDHLDLDKELVENFREIYQRVRTKIAERQHPWIIDLSDRFDGNDYIFIDFCHVSSSGNAIIAREISQAVPRLSGESRPVKLATP
jgi:hypothetical protein